MREEICKGISRLSPFQRAVAMAFYFDNLPVTEIAAGAGCSESTIRRLLTEIGERLRTAAALSELTPAMVAQAWQQLFSEFEMSQQQAERVWTEIQAALGTPI